MGLGQKKIPGTDLGVFGVKKGPKIEKSSFSNFFFSKNEFLSGKLAQIIATDDTSQKKWDWGQNFFSRDRFGVFGVKKGPKIEKSSFSTFFHQK